MRPSPIAALAFFLLASCTTTRVGQDRLAERDPLEGFNRGVWGFNQAVDKVILKPVTQVYRAVLPRPVRRGVTHFFANLGEPFSAVNNLLQGKPGRAAQNLGRFVVNTTVGVAGLGDPATKMGIKPAPEDFGQTLAAWGVNGGPYLVLPILGPSTLRDGVGTGVEFAADPYNVCLRDCGLPSGVPTALTATYVIDTRSTLIDAGADGFLESSADPYATARSAYLQRRRAAILNQDEIASAPSAVSEDEALKAAVQDIDAGDGAGAPADAQTPSTTLAPAPSGEAPPASGAGTAEGAQGGSTGDAGLDAALTDIDQNAAPTSDAPGGAPEATAPADAAPAPEAAPAQQ